MDTVLERVVERARVIKGADFGEEPRDFYFSGFKREGELRMLEWPDAPRLFGRFRCLEGAIRLGDMPAYVHSPGFW